MSAALRKTSSLRADLARQAEALRQARIVRLTDHRMD